MTTFNGRKLEERFKGRHGNINWQDYLAIAPCKDHPLCKSRDGVYKTLTLERGARMSKPGYVRISQVWSMEWQDTKTLRTQKLSHKSMRRVLDAVARRAQYTPDAQCDPAALLHVAPVPQAAESMATVPARPLHSDAQLTPPRSGPVAAVHPADLDPVPITAQPLGEGYVASGGIDERQPLLPTYNVRPRSHQQHQKRGILGSLWDHSKRIRYGVVVRALCCYD